MITLKNMQIILFFSLIYLISPQEILTHHHNYCCRYNKHERKATIIPNAADNTEFIFLKS